MSLLRIEHLSKSFGNLQVLDDVSLSVEPGERIVIIGESGCGKSVFLRSMELLEKPDSGHIFIGEDEITAKGADVNHLRQNMGMVYQGFHLFDHMSVLDNITLAPRKLKKQSREEAEKKACELLQLVGLESKKHVMPTVLSGGQKQRVAIARCLAMEPEVILFDEPTSALDPSMVGEVLATMRLLAKKQMTMVIVTHEMTFAREVGTRILYFDNHGIYEEGTPEEVFDHPQRPKTQAFVRKIKYFSYHIDNHAFDLMQIQGGIHDFAERYGIDDITTGHVQLCTEEMIYEMLSGVYKRTSMPIDMNIDIEYSESDKSIFLTVRCDGQEYNPFTAQGEEEDSIRRTLIRNVGKSNSYQYENGINICMIQI